ncbi:CU044_2847 family protein [Kitasatospora purpeofusca]|uniref:CU044_2847 family protein n=1 Tax=Kitasatospora purpeofusca TaxID=67352 RepID=UPI002A599B3F|nr:CU044_2847 family protein [Kitasatospora purpeofusca]MDY0814101.1 CU044_2847 family protein [Kitasatospora purpeofusca]
MTIDLGDGTTVRAEVIGEVNFQHPEAPSDVWGDSGDAAWGGGRRAASQLGSAVALTLDQVRSTVQGVGRWAAESIAQGAAGSPDTFEVEFGLKLAVKSGQLLGVIAEAGSEAGLTVRLSWDLAERRRQLEATAAEAATAGLPAQNAPAGASAPAPRTADAE